MAICFHSAIKPAPVSLKEDDFPSLSGALVSAPMMPAYTNQPRKHSSFQEDDFPALVSRIKPVKPQSSAASAWSQAGGKPVTVPNKPVVLPTKTTSSVSSSILSASDPPPSASVPPTLTNSSRRKKKLTSAESNKAPHKVRCPSSSDEDDSTNSKTAQEIRAVPTMLDISTLLTVKGGSSQPNPKTNKKKKHATTTSSSSSGTPSHTAESVTKMAHKENVPEKKPPDASLTKGPTTSKINSFMNGHAPTDTSCTSFPENIPSHMKQPVTDQVPPPMEEDFPALISKKPPPGKRVFILTEASLR